MTPYHHTQTGITLVCPLLLLALFGFVMAFVSPVARVAVIPAIALLLTALVFYKLTVSIDEKKLRASFGPGVVYKEVATDEVQSCEPMRVRIWDGWGIHYTRNGWLYNISGRDAVVVRLRNGKRFAIGTDQPDELSDAIRRFASAR